MTTHPEFVDHRNGNTLLEAIRTVLPSSSGSSGVREEAQAIDEVCIATAFFSPAGFAAIADRLQGVGRVKLMIGAEAPPEAVRPARLPGDPPPAAFEREQVREGLTALQQGIRRERDSLPFTKAAAQHLKQLVAMLRNGRLETRRYERAYLHANPDFSHKVGASGL